MITTETQPVIPEGVWELPNRDNMAMVGKLKVIEGIRPDVISVSWGFGHWGYGASDTTVDGKTIVSLKAPEFLYNSIIPYLRWTLLHRRQFTGGKNVWLGNT